MSVIIRSVQLVALTAPLLLGGCEQVRGLAPRGGDASARYALERDGQGRVVRLDTVTGEVTVITSKEVSSAKPSQGARRPQSEEPRRVSTPSTVSQPYVRENTPVEDVGIMPHSGVALSTAPALSVPPPTPFLAAGTRVTIVRPSPVFLTADETRTPLEVLGSGAVGRVMRNEGDWYLIEFQSPRWGRRVGYLKSTVVAPGQHAIDLSVPEARLRPMDLSIKDVKLEPMDLSIKDSTLVPLDLSIKDPTLVPKDPSIRDPLEPTDLSVKDPN
jgi:hypothetical protein